MEISFHIADEKIRVFVDLEESAQNTGLVVEALNEPEVLDAIRAAIKKVKEREG